MDWKPGTRLTHRFNPDLGPGVVQESDGRTLVVVFPSTGSVLRLAANSDAIAPLTLREGALVRLGSTGERTAIVRFEADGKAVLTDGSQADPEELWPLDSERTLFERLAEGDVDRLDRFSLRLDALRLARIREADGLGSFLGGRIRLFPHQLYAAESATSSDPVRWLLADEVGLGKTVEACLVLNHLLRTGRADRTLVVAPETLTVQWLGELWRKYHQVFVLLDDKRLEDVQRDYGPGFNPFDAHRRVVVGQETLVRRRKLTEQAVEAGIDLLVVDEAHHLRRQPGHPGNPEYRSIRPISDAGGHVLLLSATPMEDDAEGFFRLLQLLRPDEFPEDTSFEERLDRGIPLPACTSSTRRADIGGLPPRVPAPVDLDDAEGWEAQAAIEKSMREIEATNKLTRRRKARRIRRALASGAALDPLLDPADEINRALAREATEVDPRIGWLARMAPRWKRSGDKTLIFVAHRESLEAIKTAMGRLAQTRVGVFHEDLSPGQRDIEVAQFRVPAGPSILVSTECGGEGRNFEFCTRLVLFDLPWNPIAVEQRIGRLDRIGRRIPVEIAYFRPPGGMGAVIAELYESLGLFRQPLGGVERELAGVEEAVSELALSDDDHPDGSRFAELVREARAAWTRVDEAAFRELHRNPFDGSMAEGILARVPEDLEELTEDVVLAAADALHLHVEEHRGGTRHSIELGTHARVETLPGVPTGSSFLGTFDRASAVEDETIDFYASGHPLVEGILDHVEDSRIGRVALLHIGVEDPADEGFGLVAIYKEGAEFETVAIDGAGRPRPNWVAAINRRPLRSRRVRADDWTRHAGWAASIRGLARHLEGRGRPVAVAAIRAEVRSRG